MVHGPAKKCAEGRGKGDLASISQAHGHTYHVLLRNETFEETVRIGLHELLGERGVLGISVQSDDVWVGRAKLHKGAAVGFSGGHVVSQFGIWRSHSLSSRIAFIPCQTGRLRDQGRSRAFIDMKFGQSSLHLIPFLEWLSVPTILVF